jgi:prenyltransferase beta subunit
MYDVLHEINKDKLIEFVCGLQQADGSFAGDAWGNFYYMLNLT